MSLFSVGKDKQNGRQGDGERGKIDAGFRLRVSGLVRSSEFIMLISVVFFDSYL